MKIADKHKTSLFFIAALFISAVSIWLTFYHFVEFSGFAAGFAKALICISFFIVYDKTVLRKVDTITIITKHPIAYAIFILSHAIIFGACIATA